jgi:hypothetical protein
MLEWTLNAKPSTLEDLEKEDKLLLSYFCEWLVQNRAIAMADAPNPIESSSAIATSVQRFVNRRLPQHGASVQHDIYLQMTRAAWALGYPQRFFKLEPIFSRRLQLDGGS